MKFQLAAMAMIVLSACGGSGDGPDPGSVNPSLPAIPQNMSFPDMLNHVRIYSGAGVVEYESRLETAAQAHADDMLANDFFDHEGSDGSNHAVRIARTGYVASASAENIAKGYATERDVMVGWTNSPGHHANDINPVYEDFGLAVAGSGADKYWVLVLASELPTPP